MVKKMIDRKEEIKQLLKPLFEMAIKEKKWFLCSYQGLLFSPKELKERNDKGELLWGPANWTLVDPPKEKDPNEAFERVVDDNYNLRVRIHNGFSI